MKYLTLLTAVLLTAATVNAENLFQSNNPFPQTAPQSMNNIYESDPSVMQEEQAKAQEREQTKKSWFKRKKSSSDHVIPEAKVINEGANNVKDEGSFFIFK